MTKLQRLEWLYARAYYLCGGEFEVHIRRYRRIGWVHCYLDGQRGSIQEWELILEARRTKSVPYVTRNGIVISESTPSPGVCSFMRPVVFEDFGTQPEAYLDALILVVGEYLKAIGAAEVPDDKAAGDDARLREGRTR